MSQSTITKPTNAADTRVNSRTVRFLLMKPEAHEVFLAGSFNNWNPGATPLTNLGHGRWVGELSLPPGRYEYQFVVDGHWVQDRTAKELVDNPLGGINSVVAVAQPNTD